MASRNTVVALVLVAGLAAAMIASQSGNKADPAAKAALQERLQRERSDAERDRLIALGKQTLLDARAFEAQWLKVKAKKAASISTADLHGLRSRADEVAADAPEKAEIDAILARLGPDTAAIQAASDAAFERMAKARAAIDEKEQLAARKAYPAKAESAMLDMGHDFYLSVEGPGNRTLRIKYVLMSRPMVHQFSKKGDLIRTWRGLGFQKVVFTDGFNQAWSLDLR